MPATQLVKFYQNRTYACDDKMNIVQGEGDGSGNEIDLSDEMILSGDDIPGNSKSKHQTCQRTESFQSAPSQSSVAMSTPKKSNKLVSSQIIIISSKELPPSSDESSSIDVGTNEIISGTGKTRNP